MSYLNDPDYLAEQEARAEHQLEREAEAHRERDEDEAARGEAITARRAAERISRV